MKISDMLFRLTCKVTAIDSTKNLGWGGTGFFFIFDYNDKTKQGYPAIVSNRHVFEGANEARFIFQGKDDQPYEINIDKFDEKVILHPNPEVDLAIYPCSQEVIELNEACGWGNNWITDDLLLTNEKIINEYSDIENVLTMGYPYGISDLSNNIPIARMGITATPMRLDYEGKPEFLIDALIVEGCSGSPVFVFDKLVSSKNNTRTFFEAARFAGIVYSGIEQNKYLYLIRVLKASLILDFMPLIKSYHAQQ